MHPSSLPGGVVCKRPWRPPPPESTETLLPTWMGSQWAGTQCHSPATTQGDPPLAWTGDYATSHCCLMCGSRRCHDDCDYSVPSSRQQYTHGSRRLRLVGRVSKVGRSRSIPQQSALQAPTDREPVNSGRYSRHCTTLYSISLYGWMDEWMNECTRPHVVHRGRGLSGSSSR